MKAASLLFLISANAFALDCAGMPEGLVVRLDRKGGPLEKSAIQDQDGVGSCYANQASIMLQSVIPNNPNLSYLNLGLYYATDYTIPKSRASGNNSYTHPMSKGSVIDGGFSCKAINAALNRQKQTKAGVLCKSSDVTIEHSFFSQSSNKDNQNKVLTASADYMTKYQSVFGKPEDLNSATLQSNRSKADQFKFALKKFIQEAGDGYDKECNKNAGNWSAQGGQYKRTTAMLDMVENALIKAFTENPKCMKNPSSSETCQSLSQYAKMATKNPNSNSSQIDFTLSEQLKSQLKNAESKIFQNASSPAASDKVLAEIANQLKIADKSKNSEQDKKLIANIVIKSIYPNDVKNLFENNSSNQSSDVELCKQGKFMSAFTNGRFIVDASKDVVLCNYKGLLSNARDLASTLPMKTAKDMSTFVDFITEKAGLKYDEAILPLIATDCSVDKRVLIPEELTCNQVVMNFKAGDFKAGSKAPVTSEATEVIKANRKRMLASLDSDTALGITVCSRYWKDPSYGYNTYPTRAERAQTCTNGRDSFHSIAAIGYRCKNNKVQYLAQNSWGPNWKESNNKDMEFENGKAWLDEDTLFQNLETIDYMSL